MRITLGSVRKFLRLSVADKMGIIRVALTAIAVDVGIRLVPLPRLAGILGVSVGTGGGGVSVATGSCGSRVGAAHKARGCDGVNHVEAGVEAGSGVGAGAPALTAQERRALRTVAAVFRLWPERGRCLRESLVLGNALRHRRPLLRIGMAREGGELRGHAWLEIDGVALDPDAPAFIPLRAARSATGGAR
ncbi:MAG: lasso peptide biosynthesis B2 protein [Actinomycetota bacterium]